MATTALARAGGFARVRHIVDAFYDRVLDDPALERHFAGIDMARLVDHQTKLVAGLMAGDHAIDDAMLQRVHARLGITGPEFDTLQRLLRETLDELHVEPNDVDRVCREFERRRHLVVSPRSCGIA
jgi:hemoglobin